MPLKKGENYRWDMLEFLLKRESMSFNGAYSIKGKNHCGKSYSVIKLAITVIFFLFASKKFQGTFSTCFLGHMNETTLGVIFKS